MRADYQDLIKEVLFEKEWTPQESILSVVARKRHGISRSGDKKKGAVLIALKAMLRKGVLRKAVDEDGNVFWGKRPSGEEPIVFWEKTKVDLDIEELTKLSTARKNIAFLEDALKDLFSGIFENAYALDWERHIGETTREKLIFQYGKSRKEKWRQGGSPEDLFSVAGIKDFSYIMGFKENRELFKRAFPNTFVVSAKLAELGDFRNRIQHNEKISKEELVYFNAAVGLLLKDLQEKSLN